MARTTTAQQDIDLQALAYGVYAVVEVANADGTFIRLDTLSGVDWLTDVEIQQDIDRPVPQATISFRRDREDGDSLAPLMTASPLNVDDLAVYAPLLDAGRAVRVSTAVVAVGVTPAFPAAYQRVFDGEIDVVLWDSDPVRVICRNGPGAEAADRIIESRRPYSVATDDIAVVQQAILTDWTSLTLDVIGTPAFAINPFVADGESVHTAIDRLASLIGWKIEDRWSNAAGEFRLTMYEPDRTKTIPDHTFGPEDYFAVQRLEVNRHAIRNAISVVCFVGAGQTPTTVAVSDAASITRFGRRFMRVTEPSDSPVNSSGEATTFANAMLSDLANPGAELVVEARYFWPLQLGDLYRFTDNDIHFDTSQDFAVSGFRHVLSNGFGRTFISTRGSPAGAYRNWQVLKDRKERDRDEPAPVLRNAFLRSVPQIGAGAASAGIDEDIRPDSDVETSDWTATPLWQKIDEAVRADGDFITSADSVTACPSETDFDFEVGLGNPVGTPAVGTEQRMLVRTAMRANLPGTPGTASAVIALVEGTTVRASHFTVLDQTSFTAYDFELTATEVDSIGDHDNLRVRVTVTTCHDNGTDLVSIDFSWCEVAYISKLPPQRGTEIDLIYEPNLEVDELDIVLRWNDGAPQTYSYTLASIDGDDGVERLEGPGAVDFIYDEGWTAFEVDVTPVAQPRDESGKLVTLFIEDGAASGIGIRAKTTAGPQAVSDYFVPGLNVTVDLDNDGRVRLNSTAAPGGSGVTDLPDLDDVTITAVGSGEVLGFTGSVWENRTPAELGLVTSLVEGEGIALTTPGGPAVTVALDLDDLGPAVAADADHIAVVDDVGAQRKIAVGTLPLSLMLDDIGAGGVTAVTVGVGLLDTGTATVPNITLDFGALPVPGPVLTGADEMLVLDAGVESREQFLNIPLTVFTGLSLTNNEVSLTAAILVSKLAPATFGGSGLYTFPDDLRVNDQFGVGAAPAAERIHADESTASVAFARLRHTHATLPLGLHLHFTGTPNNRTAYFLRNQDGGVNRSVLHSDGGATWQGNHDGPGLWQAGTIASDFGGTGLKNAGITAQDLLASLDGTSWTGFGIGTEGQVLQVSAGNLAWGAGGGTVTNVSAGATSGIDVATGSTTPVLSLDLAELPVSAALDGADSLAVAESGMTRRKTIGAIPLSIFINDANWTNNAGDITRVDIGAASGLTGSLNTVSGDHIQNISVGAGAGIKVNTDDVEFDPDSLTDLASGLLGGDHLVVVDGTVAKKAHISGIALSIFSQVLGTVSAGTWQGTGVAEAFGGTGQTGYTAGDIIYAAGATNLNKLTAAGHDGKFLKMETGFPAWVAGGGGSVTDVSSASAGLTVATPTTTPVLTLAMWNFASASVPTGSDELVFAKGGASNEIALFSLLKLSILNNDSINLSGTAEANAMIISPAAGVNAVLDMEQLSGSSATQIRHLRGGNLRWGHGAADSSDVNDYEFYRYNNAGSFQGTALSLDRATGGATFEDTVGMGGASAHANISLQVGQAGSGDRIASLTHSHASVPQGVFIGFIGASPDDNTQDFLNMQDSTTLRAIIDSDGDMRNHDGTFAMISDERLKTAETPARSQWEDVKWLGLNAINYRMKVDGRSGRTFLGWGAQSVRAAGMGGLVMDCDDKGNGSPEFPGIGPHLALRTSIIHTKAVVALGEAMLRIERLEDAVATLRKAA